MLADYPQHDRVDLDAVLVVGTPGEYPTRTTSAGRGPSPRSRCGARIGNASPPRSEPLRQRRRGRDGLIAFERPALDQALVHEQQRYAELRSVGTGRKPLSDLGLVAAQ